MAYTKQDWKDLPDRSTPITAERLLHIEDGIGDNDTNITNLSTEFEEHKNEFNEYKTTNDTKVNEINDNTVKLTGNQTINGPKIFEEPIVVNGEPTEDNHVVRKQDLDSKVILNKNLINNYISTKTETLLNDAINNYDFIIVFTQANAYGHNNAANIYAVGVMAMDKSHQLVIESHASNTPYYDFISLSQHDNTLITTGSNNIGDISQGGQRWQIIAVWGIKIK